MAFRRDVMVYISGPITPTGSWTLEDNLADATRVYWELLRRGVPAICPHLASAFPTAWTLLPHAAWLDYDEILIDLCSHLLLLPRWGQSLGARHEKAYAERRGILVFHGVTTLLEAVCSSPARPDTAKAAPSSSLG